MDKKELASRIDVTLVTLKNWEESRPELLKLIERGLATEAHLETLKNSYEQQKELLRIDDKNFEIIQNKTKKTDLSRRINTSTKTILKWETTKPELIKLINLGLSSERYIKELKTYISEIDLQS